MSGLKCSLGIRMGARLATPHTLVETAKANNLEPWVYLNHLFEKPPAAESEKTLLQLLPQNLIMAHRKYDEYIGTFELILLLCADA